MSTKFLLFPAFFCFLFSFPNVYKEDFENSTDKDRDNEKVEERKCSGKRRIRRKRGRKSEKAVDTGGRSWYYIQALAERAFERGAERGRGNLENDTEKREKRQLILK